MGGEGTRYSYFTNSIGTRLTVIVAESISFDADLSTVVLPISRNDESLSYEWWTCCLYLPWSCSRRSSAELWKSERLFLSQWSRCENVLYHNIKSKFLKIFRQIYILLFLYDRLRSLVTTVHQMRRQSSIISSFSLNSDGSANSSDQHWYSNCFYKICLYEVVAFTVSPTLQCETFRIESIRKQRLS